MTREHAARVPGAGTDGIEAAIALATPMSRHRFDVGAIPEPNPVGVPRL